jgi:hypothetical protein
VDDSDGYTIVDGILSGYDLTPNQHGPFGRCFIIHNLVCKYWLEGSELHISVTDCKIPNDKGGIEFGNSGHSVFELARPDGLDRLELFVDGVKAEADPNVSTIITPAP